MVNRTVLGYQSPLDSVSQPMRGPFIRWPRAADTVLALIVFLATLFLSSGESDQDLTIRALSDVPVAGYMIIAVASGALYWRRYQPLLVLGLILAALVLSTGLGYSYDYFGVPIALYSVGCYANNDRWSYAGLIAGIAVAALSGLIDHGLVTDVGAAFFILFLVWYLGRRIRIRGDFLRLLQERAAQLEKEQVSEARRAVLEERTRIARELHDVVAHQVSLMTVQAGAATTVAADDPESALRAMEAVEKAGRQALDELRHLMGILRPETESGRLGPQPGLADVPRLVEQLREAGLEIALTMAGEQIDLPARVDLSTYRIIQEALTNVLKHAGPGARTEVKLSADKQGVAIEVLDSGNGGTILPGSGHGIVGMRERVQLLGGHLDSGPRPGGGFKIVAHLPIGEEPI